MNSSGEQSIVVDGSVLLPIVKSIKRMKGLGRKRAQLTCQSGKLVIEFEDLQASIPVTGAWTGCVHVTKPTLSKLASRPLDQYPHLTLTVAGKRLNVLGQSYVCGWSP